MKDLLEPAVSVGYDTFLTEFGLEQPVTALGSLNTGLW